MALSVKKGGIKHCLCADRNNSVERLILIGRKREAGIALGVPLRRKEGDGICAKVEQREMPFPRKGRAGCLLKDANAEL